MRKIFWLMLVCAPMAIVATSACQPIEQTTGAAKGAATQVVITNAIGRKVQATYYPALAPKALILLFHQAGSDRREYDEIVPRLLAANYSALTVDQGGDGFGQSMIAGKPDMEATLNWAQDKSVPIVVWDSSYSASITYLLAAEQPTKMKAVLVFSGGEYLGANRVSQAARTVTIPLFATSSPEEVTEMRSIFDLVPSPQKTFHTPSLGGLHGSSTLSLRDNPRGAEANWQAVLTFLDGVLQK